MDLQGNNLIIVQFENMVEADGADGTGQGTRDGGGTASADHRQARATGAGPRPGVEARQAATNYVLETVRKRLER